MKPYFDIHDIFVLFLVEVHVSASYTKPEVQKALSLSVETTSTKYGA